MAKRKTPRPFEVDRKLIDKNGLSYVVGPIIILTTTPGARNQYSALDTALLRVLMPLRRDITAYTFSEERGGEMVDLGPGGSENKIIVYGFTFFGKPRKKD